VRDVTCRALDNVLNQRLRRKKVASTLEEIHRLLEALPLSSVEFALAVNRLANARRYHRSGEYGAAKYELRLLRTSLER
jgi:hypothetical protein